MDRIKNKALLQNHAFVNGQWVSAASGKEMTVTNPFNGEVLTKVADLGAADATAAIEAAHNAFNNWKNQTAAVRAKLLKCWHALILNNQDDLALLLTLEQGKPLKEAVGEVIYGASFIEWFAEEAQRVYGDVIPGHTKGTRIITLKQPVGVVAAITPWNFPIAMITRKAAPALAAGCTVVVKPAEDTPLCAIALAALASQAGFPPGVLNLITTSSPSEVGKVLTTSPLVRKVSFTGSTEVGKLLMSQCASSIKKISLELGGNAPFIVMDDADLDAAVKGAIVSKYRNAGQTCISANRILVQETVHDTFVKKLTAAARELKVGSGTGADTDIGPLINAEAVNKVNMLVNDARSKGAKIVLGGELHPLGGTFYAPTVITEATSAMTLSSEEIFGPVTPVYRFATDEEAIQMANNTPYGLAAYFYGKDMARIWRMAEALEYGMVGINTGQISTAAAPFGGIKESGIGREGSKYGMEDYLEIKYLCLAGI